MCVSDELTSEGFVEVGLARTEDFVGEPRLDDVADDLEVSLEVGFVVGGCYPRELLGPLVLEVGPDSLDRVER